MVAVCCYSVGKGSKSTFGGVCAMAVNRANGTTKSLDYILIYLHLCFIVVSPASLFSFPITYDEKGVIYGFLA